MTKKQSSTLHLIRIIALTNLVNVQLTLLYMFNISSAGWPNDLLINEVKSAGVLLVAKQPKEGSEEERYSAWRYAFNKAEKILILSTWPSIPNNCRRRVLKIMKGLNNDYKWNMKSYFIKTLMLWEYENCEPTAWTEANFLDRLKNSLKRLENAIKDKKLNHYFLPTINLFKNLEESKANHVLKSIIYFLKNPGFALDELNSPESGRFYL